MVESKSHETFPRSDIGVIGFELNDNGTYVQGGVITGSILINLN